MYPKMVDFGVSVVHAKKRWFTPNKGGSRKFHGSFTVVSRHLFFIIILLMLLQGDPIFFLPLPSDQCNCTMQIHLLELPISTAKRTRLDCMGYNHGVSTMGSNWYQNAYHTILHSTSIILKFVLLHVWSCEHSEFDVASVH